MANGQVVLRGQAPNLVAAEQAVQLAQPYASKVLNFLEISGGQQVMLQVRFAEVSRSATNALGFNFGGTDGRSFFGNNIGQVNPLGTKDSSTPGGGAVLSIISPNPAVTMFGSGVVGDTAFAYYITALRQNNLLRVLAEPNLTAISGEEASFLAGGSFPVPVTQGGGTGAGGTAITVEYRAFGVKLKFTPVVLGDGKIRLKVAPEVSDLDFTTAVRFNGYVIPGLTERKLQTVIEMREGQTFALAGLLNNNVSATKDVTPVLGDLPVLGALFRSVRYQRKETELVVIVTPRLVEAVNPAQVPVLPGERWRHPTEGDLFWQRDIGGPAGNPKRAAVNSPAVAGEAPRFKGQFGYSTVDGQDE
jgi:pilus assembly protein CpaC